VITEHDIAELCLAIYPGQPPVQWDHLELPPDGIAFGSAYPTSSSATWRPFFVFHMAIAAPVIPENPIRGRFAP
jgi:hypothetical protein